MLALSPKAARRLSVAGVAVVLILLALPVEARFADHPLLRLGQLDPSLTPRTPEVDCGPALSAAGDRAGGPGLFEVARADACRDAGRRRVLTAVAGGSVLVLLGLIGRVRSTRAAPTAPVPVRP